MAALHSDPAVAGEESQGIRLLPVTKPIVRDVSASLNMTDSVKVSS